jgi:hypothetical protein
MSRTKEVEMLFAHLKRILRLGRLRLRGPKWSQGRSSYWPSPPKTSGKWRRSSLFRRRSSPHKAERPSFASVTAPQIPVLASQQGVFNKIDVKRTLLVAPCMSQPDGGGPSFASVSPTALSVTRHFSGGECSLASCTTPWTWGSSRPILRPVAALAARPSLMSFGYEHN